MKEEKTIPIFSIKTPGCYFLSTKSVYVSEIPPPIDGQKPDMNVKSLMIMLLGMSISHNIKLGKHWSLYPIL